MQRKEPVQITKDVARRLMLYRQGLLEWSMPDGTEGRLWRKELRGIEGVQQVISQLGAVQLDPVAIVERNHHLVLYNRVGEYHPEQLDTLYRQKQVFEEFANARCILPIEHYPQFRLKMHRRKQEWAAEWSRLNGAIEYVCRRLETEGALPARSLESPERVQGYWDLAAPKTKTTTQALEHLFEAGEVVVALRAGEERLFALARHWLPEDLVGLLDSEPSVSPEELLAHYIHCFGLLDAGDFRFGWWRWTASERRQVIERKVDRGELVPVAVEGVRRLYYAAEAVLPLMESLERAEVAPEISFLPPLDNLLWRRERVQDLFDFEYKWEIYTPPSKRRFGAYAMPVLEGDCLIGRLDPKLDRDKGVLRIQRLEWEPGIQMNKARWKRFEQALQDFAQFHGAVAEL